MGPVVGVPRFPDYTVGGVVSSGP